MSDTARPWTAEASDWPGYWVLRSPADRVIGEFDDQHDAQQVVDLLNDGLWYREQAKAVVPIKGV